MVDVSIKLAVLATLAWLATRTATHAQAAAAHVMWRVVLVSPVAWLVLSGLLEPRVYVQPKEGLWPVSITESTAALPVAVVYLTVAGLLLLRLGWGLVAVGRLRRSAAPLSDDDRAVLRACGGSAAGSVRFLDAPLDVPVTIGVVRPAVLLPRGWRTLPPDALRAIVHHELAHVRRGDYAWGVVAAAIEAVLWFHPAVWIAGNRLRWFAELASDAEGASALGDRRYASELLALAAQWRGAPRPRYGVTVGASSSVGRRIALLLEDRGVSRVRRVLLACAVAAVILTVPAAGAVRIGPAPSGFWTAPAFDLPGHLADHVRSHRAAHHGM